VLANKRKIIFISIIIVCTILVAFGVAWVLVSLGKSLRPVVSTQSVFDISPSASIIPTNDLSNKNAENVLVTRVIDGDTIELGDGRHVRYIGINTPETVDKRVIVQCFGKEASNKNSELVLNKQVRMEKDISDKDKYGRLLRYVYVGDVFVNEFLVREGYAHVSSYPPDIKYRDQFRFAEQKAREAKAGLWESCPNNAD